MSKISELSDGGVIQGGDTLIAVRSGGNVKVTYGGSTTANIDGGTIDGTVIGGSTAAAGSFTTLTASGEITANAGIALPDNQKATFGASDDLQIYHDGTNSVVGEVGTGNLYVQSNGAQILLQPIAGEQGIVVNSNADVGIYYDNSLKLATTATGIDVTGTVTADGFESSGNIEITASSPAIQIFDTDVSGRVRMVTANAKFNIHADFDNVDSSTQMGFSLDGKEFLLIDDSGDISFYDDTGVSQSFYWDASAQSLNVDGPITADGLTVDGKITVNAATTSLFLNETDTTDENTQLVQASGTFRIRTADDSGSNVAERLRIDHATGDLSLFEDTGTTAKFYWDASAEFLGIGTDTQTNNGESLRLINGLFINTAGTSSVPSIAIGDSNSGLFAPSAGSIAIATQGSQRLTVDPTGKVGINTSSPVKLLELSGNNSGDTSDNPVATLRLSDLDGSTASEQPIGKIEFYGNDPTVPSQNVMAYILSKAASTSGGGDLRFGVCPSGVASEKMRLDYSGNLLIGQTTIPTGLGASNTKLILGSVEDSPEFVAYNSDNAIELGDKIGAYLFGNDDNNATEDHFAGMWAKSASTTGAMDIHFAAGKSNYEDDSPHMTLDNVGNLGINTTTPAAKLEIGGAGEGIILASPDGTRYEITVANGGTLTVTAV